MKTIYLDNASTTCIDKEVADFMYKSMLEHVGNPSSTHQLGRKAKSLIETARKNIAKHFNVSASEIIFTSSATESNNLILHNAVVSLNVQTIITSKIEHHAVLNTVLHLQNTYNIKVKFVDVDAFGSVNLEHLKTLLQESNGKTLVSLLYINNEIGNILPIDAVCKLCKEHDALFHSDTVQAIGNYAIDLQKTPIDFIVASAHKFHGPKGVGFAYIKKGFKVAPILFGGGQEKGVRSSTENVHGILGMEKALTIAYANREENEKKITGLKTYFIQQLQENFKDIQFNGLSSNLTKSSFKILNVRFNVNNKMLLFSLDLEGIAVSSGSACQSGANKKSHVLLAFLNAEEVEKSSVRFSFSKFTSKAELDVVLEKLKKAKT